jgi:hypothetical protein
MNYFQLKFKNGGLLTIYYCGIHKKTKIFRWQNIKSAVKRGRTISLPPTERKIPGRFSFLESWLKKGFEYEMNLIIGSSNMTAVTNVSHIHHQPPPPHLHAGMKPANVSCWNFI